MMDSKKSGCEETRIRLAKLDMKVNVQLIISH